MREGLGSGRNMGDVVEGLGRAAITKRRNVRVKGPPRAAPISIHSPTRRATSNEAGAVSGGAAGQMLAGPSGEGERGQQVQPTT